jgi:NAD(P)-dependent dehydrogenase (short-subunit alcohol dehydrogenase family)
MARDGEPIIQRIGDPVGGNLSGKVVLVTGGARGLGAATAAAFADAGADVAISYVASDEKAAAVVARLETKGVRARAFKVDQGTPSSAKGLMAAVVAHFGKLDVLVNNAAVSYIGKSLDDPTIDDNAMDRMWTINTAGVVANIRAAAKVLPNGGRIISVGSGVSTHTPFPGLTDYAATKAAIVSYSRGAARDLGDRNITVNVVQAGTMATDSSGITDPDSAPAEWLAGLCIKRVAKLEEVAAAIVFLAGPDAGYITGTVIDVSGGGNA